MFGQNNAYTSQQMLHLGSQQILIPSQQMDYSNQQNPQPNAMNNAHNNFKKPRSKQNQKFKHFYSKLYIQNLPSDIKTNDDLADMFSQFGTVKSPFLMKEGTALCMMADHKSAVSAINALNGKFLEGKLLVVRWALNHKDKKKQKVVNH